MHSFVHMNTEPGIGGGVGAGQSITLALGSSKQEDCREFVVSFGCRVDTILKIKNYDHGQPNGSHCVTLYKFYFCSIWKVI